MKVPRWCSLLAFAAAVVAGCSEEPPTEIVHGPEKVAIVYGRVTTPAGEPLPPRGVTAIEETRDTTCTRERYGGGINITDAQGRYRTVTGVPGFVPSRRCLIMIFDPGSDGPWQRDSVTVGLITLRYEDRGVPLDSIRVDFVLKRKAQP
jgi:hypothetical protein